MSAMRKFHNHPIDNADGHFDSTDEWRRFMVLKEAEANGVIKDLQRQVTFVLLPKQEKDVVIHLKTKDKTEKRMVARQITYTADFVYMKRMPGIPTVFGEAEVWHRVVEDYKGFPNDRWSMKKAMMYYFHGIEVREVNKPGEPV